MTYLTALKHAGVNVEKVIKNRIDNMNVHNYNLNDIEVLIWKLKYVMMIFLITLKQ